MQYANDKLDLMFSLELAEADQINLLANGIRDAYMRAMALTVRGETLPQFLDRMRVTTENVEESLQVPGPATGGRALQSRPKSPRCDNCRRRGHSARECRARKVICYRCQQEGHISSQCPRNGQLAIPRGRGMPTVGAVEQAEVEAEHSVAAIREAEHRASKQDPTGRQKELWRDIVPTVKITEINKTSTVINAVVDTGSPISLIVESAVKRNLSNMQIEAWSNELSFKGVNESNVKILGAIQVEGKLGDMNDLEFTIKLLVVPDKTISYSVGRDFLFENNLKLTVSYANILLSKLPDYHAEILSILNIDFDEGTDKYADIADNLDKDVSFVNRQKLVEMFREIESMSIEPCTIAQPVKVYLKNDTVFSFGSRRFSYTERTELKQITDDLLERKIIKPSISPYCSRVVLVTKRNGKKRMCVDLRSFNDLVQKQRFTFPIIEDQLNKLQGKKVFTSSDLKDGFHQIDLHPESTKYFGFSTPHGQYEFLKLPFGYVEAPAEFQKRIIQIFEHLVRDDKVLIYMDDILIATDTIDQNLHILKEVLITLRKYKLELNLSKCQFLRNTIEYLGYKVSNTGITMSERHTKAIANYPMPKTLKQLQSFLGLANYFRKFIKDFSIKANALHRLTKKGVEFVIDAEAVRAFNNLKRELVTYPVLRLYKPGAETQLHTDASSLGFGAVLLQKQADGAFAPIAYYSKATNDAEKHYHSYELETLAIVKAIERFHVFLQGITFKVITDCNALVWAFKKININPRIARWSLALQNYSCELAHRAAAKMVHVDALSRQVMLICAPTFEEELMHRQLSDEHLRALAENLEFKENKRFALENGIIYCVIENRLLFAVPSVTVNNVIRVYHDEMGHVGKQKTMEGINKSYWFPNMKLRVKEHIANCIKCLIADNTLNRFEEEMQLIDKGTRPFETLHMNHFGPLEKTIHGYQHILVVIDAYTKYTWLFSTKTTNSAETVSHLTYLFQHFGIPERIISDRGTSFTSKSFEQFVEPYKITHIKVAVASPWANGQVERVNRFLKSTLTKTVDDQGKWKEVLGKVQYILNNTYHKSIETTPSKMFLGYDQRCHSDIDLQEAIRKLQRIDIDLDSERAEIRDNACEANKRLQRYNQSYYNRKHRKLSRYKKGDYVMIRQGTYPPGTSKKLLPKFKGPYKVHKVLAKSRYVITDIPGYQCTSKPYNGILSSDKIKPWIRIQLSAENVNN